MSEAVFLFNGVADPNTAQQTANRNGAIRLNSSDLQGHIGTTVSQNLGHFSEKILFA